MPSGETVEALRLLRDQVAIDGVSFMFVGAGGNVGEAKANLGRSQISRRFPLPISLNIQRDWTHGKKLSTTYLKRFHVNTSRPELVMVQVLFLRDGPGVVGRNGRKRVEPVKQFINIYGSRSSSRRELECE